MQIRNPIATTKSISELIYLVVLVVAIMKQLIQCPHCEEQGNKEILGEIDNNSIFNVLRYHNGITTVISQNYSVQCGKCKSIVYIKSGDSSLIKYKYD